MRACNNLKGQGHDGRPPCLCRPRNKNGGTYAVCIFRRSEGAAASAVITVQKMTDLVEDVSGGAWTDEKHISFLKWMEASFVSRMLVGGGFANAAGAGRGATPLRLDRYLPDGADSTLDCRTAKRGRPATEASPDDCRRGFAEDLRRTRKRMKRGNTTAARDQDDQVVPVFEGMKGGENVRPLSVPKALQLAATDEEPPTEREKKE